MVHQGGISDFVDPSQVSIKTGQTENTNFVDFSQTERTNLWVSHTLYVYTVALKGLQYTRVLWLPVVSINKCYVFRCSIKAL